ncbi:RPC3 polymerase, partial [Alcedo cyanopectus]|nr:RPC3 polymerase [Ceyx cyanopectus]
MTQAEIQLSSLLLREHFGEIVEKIGSFLLRTGAQPLRGIAGGTGLLLDQVKKALCVLIQHNLVSFQLQKRGFVEYEAQGSRILRILRYPRYIYTAKSLYGDTGELLVEELLLNGQMTMSGVVRKVADRLTDTMEDGKSMDYAEVLGTFVLLADTHFVQRCPLVPDTPQSPGTAPAPAPTLVLNEKEMFLVPKLSLAGEEPSGAPWVLPVGSGCCQQGLRSPWVLPPPADDGIYWQVNIQRFHQHFCAQGIVGAVASRMDQTSSEIVRTMLRMSEVTTSSGAANTQPLSSNEIFRSLPAGYNITKQVLDQYLTLLADDPVRILTIFHPPQKPKSFGHLKTPNSAPKGDSNFWSSEFGSRCARIFRLLLRKKHLEQKQVEDFAMIPAKEAKEMLYKLLSENLVSLQEIPKTPDHAPSRTFYLYTVNVAGSARALLGRCYKSVANLIERRQHETRENKRLLEKSQRVEAILASMQATGAEPSQLQEIEEMITAPERQQLETLKRNVNKMDASENQVDETIFVLESFIESTLRRP